MRKIAIDVENSIVAMTESGNSSRVIAKKLNVSQRTVIAVQKRRNVAPKPNVGGRPRLLNDSDARLMLRQMRTKSSKTPKQAALAINKNVSAPTARRALHRLGYMSAVKKKKPALSDKNIKARLKFCKSHENWTVEDWKHVVWSDETKINRFQSDGKEYFWHRPHERLQKHHVKQTVKHGGGSLMVWGCFTWWHLGPLVRIEGIMNKEGYLNILQTNLPDFVDRCAYPEKEVIFQQDGDPKHTAKIVQRWLLEQNFEVMQWPAQSPDLNPIENLWAVVKRRLAQYDRAPSNMEELWSRVKLEWENIPSQIIENLVESMPKRMKQVIKNKGLWIPY